jgi:ABC-type molybdenum transport system ATPase subunit/photorepair protein PhrA
MPARSEKESRAALHLSRVDVALNGRRVLKDIDLDMNPGDNWAIVGPNGSGKTTLLKVINGYQRVSKGEVTIFGESLARLTFGRLEGKLEWSALILMIL